MTSGFALVSSLSTLPTFIGLYLILSVKEIFTPIPITDVHIQQSPINPLCLARGAMQETSTNLVHKLKEIQYLIFLDLRNFQIAEKSWSVK